MVISLENGKTRIKKETPSEIRERALENLYRIPAEHKRFEYPHVYKVGISRKLMELREELRNKNR